MQLRSKFVPKPVFPPTVASFPPMSVVNESSGGTTPERRSLFTPSSGISSQVYNKDTRMYHE